MSRVFVASLSFLPGRFARQRFDSVEDTFAPLEDGLRDSCFISKVEEAQPCTRLPCCCDGPAMPVAHCHACIYIWRHRARVARPLLPFSDRRLTDKTQLVWPVLRRLQPLQERCRGRAGHVPPHHGLGPGHEHFCQHAATRRSVLRFRVDLPCAASRKVQMCVAASPVAF